MIETRIYQTEMGVEPFNVWFDKLKSMRAQQKIIKSITKMEAGLLSDVKSVGEGVLEYRIHYEKGYRIYFANDGGQLIILLAGSTKANQSREIENAKNYWSDYKRQKDKKNLKAYYD